MTLNRNIVIALTGCYLFFHFANGATNLGTLKSVQIIFRHGARTIDKTYPTDPYKDESFWPGGYHQLTCIGKTQAYLLGEYIRDRYDGYINETYNSKEIHILSSDIDRTVQSAYGVTAGLYSSVASDQPIHENNEDCDLIQWTSVPVHTIPVEFDNVLRQKAKCPKYTWLLNDFYEHSEVMKKIVTDNWDLLMYFANNTGIDMRSTSDFSDYYDALVVENYYNFTLPEWTKPIFNTKEANALGTFYFQTLTYTDDMKRLRVGPALQRLINNFNLAIDPKEDDAPKKMNLFSGHDHTMTGILDVFDLYTDGTRPTFATAIFLELHQNLSISNQESQHFEIQMYYRNETAGEAYQLEIPGCGTPCTYAKFLEIVNPFIPTHWSQECLAIPDSYSAFTTGLVWATIIISSIVVMGVLFLAIRYFMQKNQHYDRI